MEFLDTKYLSYILIIVGPWCYDLDLRVKMKAYSCIE